MYRRLDVKMLISAHVQLGRNGTPVFEALKLNKLVMIYTYINMHV